MAEAARVDARERRILVIGCGSIGRRHVGNLLALGQRNIRLVDSDEGALRQLCGEFDLTGTRELEEGLAWSPEVAIVANPTSQHVDTALAAARQGCHLFIEKPLSQMLDHTEELAQMVQQRKLIAFVACNMRFRRGPARIRQAVAEGLIGTPIVARLDVGSYLPSWRPGTDFRHSYSARQALGGGCVLDAIHEFDIVCWMFGFPSEVVAMMRPGETLGIETEEAAEIILRHQEGMLAALHLDYVQHCRQRQHEIIGSDGTVVWESRRGEVWWSEGNFGNRRVLETIAEEQDVNAMYVKELQHFFACLEGRETPCADVEFGAKVLRVALAAKESARSRSVIELAWEPSWSK